MDEYVSSFHTDLPRDNALVVGLVIAGWTLMFGYFQLATIRSQEREEGLNRSLEKSIEQLQARGRKKRPPGRLPLGDRESWRQQVTGGSIRLTVVCLTCRGAAPRPLTSAADCQGQAPRRGSERKVRAVGSPGAEHPPKHVLRSGCSLLRASRSGLYQCNQHAPLNRHSNHRCNAGSRPTSSLS